MMVLTPNQIPRFKEMCSDQQTHDPASNNQIILKINVHIISPLIDIFFQKGNLLVRRKNIYRGFCAYLIK